VYLGILDTSSSQTLLCLDDYTLANVVDVDLARVLHEGCENQSLTARAAAVIKHCLFWFAVNPHAEQLARFILNFKMTLLEFRHCEKVSGWRLEEADAVWRMFCCPHIPA